MAMSGRFTRLIPRVFHADVAVGRVVFRDWG